MAVAGPTDAVRGVSTSGELTEAFTAVCPAGPKTRSTAFRSGRVHPSGSSPNVIQAARNGTSRSTSSRSPDAATAAPAGRIRASSGVRTM